MVCMRVFEFIDKCPTEEDGEPVCECDYDVSRMIEVLLFYY
jgi:hypothetical protein